MAASSGRQFARLVDHNAFRQAFPKIMEALRAKKNIDMQRPYYVPGLVHTWEVTRGPTWLSYCRLVFQWYTYCLAADGRVDSVRRLVSDLPDLKYCVVPGWLAVGLAGIGKARSEVADLDAETERLRSG